jgi:hypothetical protein
MKTLNETTKDFIIDHFFNNGQFSGWRNIAEKLLTKGECVVAGEDCIWKGGIGNFIKVSNADEFIGCVKYSFDTDDFIKSEYFKGAHINCLDRKNAELVYLELEVDNLAKIFED